MSAILSETLALIQDRKIVVGVSGGPDSLCLLHLLIHAGYWCVIAHCNHHLRPAADDDARAVDHLARNLGLPIEIGSAAVADHAREHRLSIEEAARTLRYQFLFNVARKHNAQAVAVGHTADDQAETVLMHFLRGAGLSGIKGMTERSLLPLFDKEIPIIRPLLSVTREETMAYCQEHNLPVRYDASNNDQTYFRNKLRHALIPELQNYNPQIKQTLQRAAQALQGDYDLLNEIIASAWEDTIGEVNAKYISFDANKFELASIPLRRNLIKRAIASLSPGLRDAGFVVLTRAAESINTHGQVDLVGGMYLLREGDKIFIAFNDAEVPFATYPQIDREYTINMNQTLDLDSTWKLAHEFLISNSQSLQRRLRRRHTRIESHHPPRA
jgi:tRNA(Ile)-lysidine synthase